MAHSGRARAIITPVLDVMQTLPSFTYLLPLMLLFGIGAAGRRGLHADLLAAAGDADRGARPAEPLRRPRSRRPTRWGRRRGSGCARSSCRWPSGPSSSGINQTTMAALSMATIAAFINGPGLGQPVRPGPQRARRRRRLRARHLHRADGDHARPGHDRRERARREARPQPVAPTSAARRNVLLLAGAGVTIIVRLPLAALRLRREALGVRPRHPDRERRAERRRLDLDELVRRSPRPLANGFTSAVINKLQYVLAGTPWFITALAILAIAMILGGWRPGSPP